MLSRALFIGVGGSGGKTLRFVRNDLERRLLRGGWTGKFPQCWQFLQVDAPAEADGAEAGLPGQLPVSDYVSVSTISGEYVDYDRAMGSDRSRAEAAAGWRPRPGDVSTDPAKGAGQMRSVGRVIFAAGTSDVGNRVQRAASTLTTPEAMAELAAVHGALDLQYTPSEKDPLLFVVSSLCGGSGAGMFLDVCDLLRRLSGHSKASEWLGRPSAVLFAPDVFDELEDTSRIGVRPNALAAVSELMAGYWSQQRFDPLDEAFIKTTGGGQAGLKTQRGPQYSFLVGRKNEVLTLPDQVAVYRATGKLLSELLTDQIFQEQMGNYVVGNWAQTSRYGGQAPFCAKRTKPLAGLGFASLSMGRDVFARFAAERLARKAVDRLLRGHWTPEVPDIKSPDAALDDVLNRQHFVDTFIGACGLAEKSRDRNQVLDAIRDRKVVRQEVQTIVGEVCAELAQGGARPVVEWASTINARVAARRSDFDQDRQKVQRAAAQKWCGDIQERVLSVVAEYAGQYGLPVTRRLIAATRSELIDAISELGQERDDAERWGSAAMGEAARVLGALPGVGPKDRVAGDNASLRDAVDAAATELAWRAEAHATKLSRELLVDLEENFLGALEKALEDAQARLTSVSTRISEDKPTAYDIWPDDSIPKSWHPADNEVLLEPIDSIPAAYQEQVRATAETEDQAVAEVIAGVWNGRIIDRKPVLAQQLVTLDPQWNPSYPEVHTGQPRAAAFRFALRLEEDLLARAKAWVYSPDRSIGDYVKESLDKYLDGESATATDRRARFISLLAGTLSMAKPLVDINDNLARELYPVQLSPTLLMSPMPFGDGHPVKEEAQEFLLGAGIDPTQVAKLFQPGQARSSITVSMLLGAPFDPVVFRSLTSPIYADWDNPEMRGGFDARYCRTRRLDRAIPASTEVINAMVRGWLVARTLNLTSDLSDLDRERFSIVDHDGQRVEFPFPLIGRRPGRRAEVLPALLESLPIAMLEFSRGNRGPTNAYQRLVELGGGVRDDELGTVLYDGADPDCKMFDPMLSRWIATGQVDSAYPEPLAQFAGPAGSAMRDERRLAIVATLEKFRSQVEEEVQKTSLGQEWRAVSRTYEMAEPLTKAVEDLLAAIGQAGHDDDDL